MSEGFEALHVLPVSSLFASLKRPTLSKFVANKIPAVKQFGTVELTSFNLDRLATSPLSTSDLKVGPSANFAAATRNWASYDALPSTRSH